MWSTGPQRSSRQTLTTATSGRRDSLSVAIHWDKPAPVETRIMGAPPFGTVVAGDCLATMSEWSDGSVDVILTSPPYNLKNTSGGGFSGGGTWTRKDSEWYDACDDALPHDDYVDWQRACLSEMMRLIPDTGAVFYNHKWRVQHGLLQDRADIVDGFPVRQIIIWDRGGGMNFNDGYFVPSYEVVYLIAKPEFKLASRANGHGDVWRINPDRKNRHPAPFPIDLAKRVIGSTNARTVLDPFAGSGTTLLAAQQLGRQWVGIERSEAYCQMAEERLGLQAVAFEDDTLFSNLLMGDE